MATSYDPIERDEPLPRSASQARRRGLGYFTLFVGAAAGLAMVAVGVFAYKAGERRGAEGVAPVIVAGAGPDKVRPEEPGGMEVPNRDKQIYDRLAPDRGQQPPKVERLLPPPEAPLSPPRQVAAAQPVPPGAPPAPPSVPQLSPSDSFSQPIKPAANAAPSIEVAPPQAAKPAPPPAPVAKAPTPPAPTPREATTVTAVQTAAAGGAYRVQIAALRSEEDAKVAIARARRSTGDLLSGLSFDVKRADLGEKGVYYRVQLGPLADSTSASSLCDKLKNHKLGCMVVRP